MPQTSRFRSPKKVDEIAAERRIAAAEIMREHLRVLNEYIAAPRDVASQPRGMTAVASISTLARSSISADTCTMVMDGKCRPITRR